MEGCHPATTPIEKGLTKGDHRLIGRLMYLAHTRLDLTYALSVESVHA